MEKGAARRRKVKWKRRGKDRIMKNKNQKKRIKWEECERGGNGRRGAGKSRKNRRKGK